MQRSRKLAYWGVNVALLISSSALFAFSQPGFLVSTGLPFLAYFIFVPLFILVRRISFLSSFLWGGIYGVFNYCIFIGCGGSTRLQCILLHWNTFFTIC